MRRLVWWGTVAGFAACLIRPTLVSITPDYGYADGCIDVVVQGHHLGSKATARIGDADFLDFVAHEDEKGVPEQGTDEGFKYYGLVPESPTGEAGWFDVVLTVEGEKLEIRDGFYYRSCPGSFVVDAITVPEQVSAGDPISIVGCQLDDEVTMQFVDSYGVIVDSAALIADNPGCPSAQVHGDVPALPPGVYSVQLAHTDGTLFVGDCYYDSGDTGVTCLPLFTEVL